MKRTRQFARHLVARYGWMTIFLIAAAAATTGATRSSGRSIRSSIAARIADPADCSTSSTLCLSEGRFLVGATWIAPDGSSGTAHAVPLTSDPGYFWFFEPGNVELAVKTLNGCSVNGRFWFFAGGLTNLGVTITVTDTTTNQTRTYSNPQGQAFQPIIDAAAFENCPAGATALGNPEEPPEGFSGDTHLTTRLESVSGCADGDTVLCLKGRFRVEAAWQTPSGSGPAHAAHLTAESGYFWFFDPSNLELIVKSLDACGLESGNWFFAAGLTTVGVELKVTDTLTGEVKTYVNPIGSPLPPIQDTSAFSFCPTPTPTSTPTEISTPFPTRTPSSTPTATPTTTPTPFGPPPTIDSAVLSSTAMEVRGTYLDGCRSEWSTHATAVGRFDSLHSCRVTAIREATCVSGDDTGVQLQGPYAFASCPHQTSATRSVCVRRTDNLFACHAY
jgi:hypothetical protein